MADEGEPLVFNVRFDTSEGQRDLEQLEDRARKGVTVPVRTDAPASSSRPRAAAPQQAGVAGIIEQQLADAQSRGDSGEVARMRAQLQQIGATGAPEVAEQSRLQQQADLRRVRLAELDADSRADANSRARRTEAAIARSGPSDPRLEQNVNDAVDSIFRQSANDRTAQLARASANRQRVSAENRQQRDEGYVDRGELADDRATSRQAQSYRDLYYRTTDRLRTQDVREQRTDRAAGRLMERIPEEDRPSVERMAQQRMTQLGEEGMEALRASVQTYHADTADHRRFLAERGRAQRDYLRATKGIADDVEEGARDLDGGPQRLFGLRLGRVGQLATVGFAAHEALRVANAYQDRSDAYATAFSDPSTQYTAEQRFQQSVAQVPIAGQLAEFVARQITSPVPAEVTMRQADLQTRLIDVTKQVDQYQRVLGQEAQAAGARGSDRTRIEIDSRAENEKLQSKAAFDTEQAAKLATLKADEEDRNRTRRQRAEEEANRTFVPPSRRGNGPTPGAIGGGPNDAIPAEYIQSINDRMAAAEAQTASTERDTALKKIQDERDAANRLIEERKKADFEKAARIDFATVTAAGFRGRGQDIAAQLAEISALDAPPEVIRAKVGEVMGKIHLAAGDQADANVASELAYRGFGLEAQNRLIESRRRRDRRPLIGVETPEADEMRAQIDEQARIAREIAQQAENREHRAQEGRAAALRSTLARDPLGAGVAQAFGVYQVQTADITDPDKLLRAREDFSLATTLSRQQRLDQTHLMDISLYGREQQVKSLLARDPTGAQVAGIVAQTRSEEYQDLAGGFGAEADRARRLGQQQLDLTQQNYLDGFGGQEVSKSFPLALAFMPKYADDPAKVLKEIEDAKAGLDTAGTAEKAITLDDLKTAATDLAGKISEAITAKLTN